MARLDPKKKRRLLTYVATSGLTKLLKSRAHPLGELLGIRG
jgi:hypothetical protein